MLSSAMSRRKKSEVVQSVTTRSFREQQRQLVEVVRARDEPAGEAAQAQPEHVRDPLVAAERRHLAEHPVAVRLRSSPWRFLARRRACRSACWRGRRVGRSGRREVRHARAVAERPDVLEPLDAQVLVDRDRARARRPAARSARWRGFARTPAVQTSVCVRMRSPFESVAAPASTASSVVADVDLDAAPRQLPRRVLAEARSGSPARIFGAASTSTQRCGTSRSRG